MILAVACALAGAFCLAVATTMQQRAAKRQHRVGPLDPRLLLRLLRTRLWQFGWLPDAAGIGLQALALRFGPLALVQPLMASGLFMAILVEAVWTRRRPARRDLLASVVGVGGLGVFLTVGDPRPGLATPPATAWWGVALGAGAVVAVAVLLSAAVGEATRGALLGLAAGVLYGVTAALVKALTSMLHGGPGGLGRLLTDPLLAALVVVGLLGLVLNQAAFQRGRIAAPLTALTLAEPVVSVAVGVTAFRETLALGGARAAVLTASAVAIAVGVWLAGTARGGGRGDGGRHGAGTGGTEGGGGAGHGAGTGAPGIDKGRRRP
ncbi:DMT family transporter [Micromonospora olivasterospora]|uniref:DMT family transporter n=1 Tax=Micromonospora olivasterospora TaxID=1880 RepID=UPI0031D9887B